MRHVVMDNRRMLPTSQSWPYVGVEPTNPIVFRTESPQRRKRTPHRHVPQLMPIMFRKLQNESLGKHLVMASANWTLVDIQS